MICSHVRGEISMISLHRTGDITSSIASRTCQVEKQLMLDLSVCSDLCLTWFLNLTLRAALESGKILNSPCWLQRPCHFTLALTASCAQACSLWQSAREAETPAGGKLFPWNSAVIPGRNWLGLGRRWNEQKQIGARSYSPLEWKECHCLLFHAVKKLLSPQLP